MTIRKTKQLFGYEWQGKKLCETCVGLEVVNSMLDLQKDLKKMGLSTTTMTVEIPVPLYEDFTCLGEAEDNND